MKLVHVKSVPAAVVSAAVAIAVIVAVVVAVPITVAATVVTVATASGSSSRLGLVRQLNQQSESSVGEIPRCFCFPPFQFPLDKIVQNCTI